MISFKKIPILFSLRKQKTRRHKKEGHGYSSQNIGRYKVKRMIDSFQWMRMQYDDANCHDKFYGVHSTELLFS